MLFFHFFIYTLVCNYFLSLFIHLSFLVCLSAKEIYSLSQQIFHLLQKSPPSFTSVSHFASRCVLVCVCALKKNGVFWETGCVKAPKVQSSTTTLPRKLSLLKAKFAPSTKGVLKKICCKNLKKNTKLIRTKWGKKGWLWLEPHKRKKSILEQ